MIDLKIPELDVKNLIFKSIFEMQPPFAFDPIAKLDMPTGRNFREKFEFGYSFVSLFYTPHLSLTDLEGPYDEESQKAVSAKTANSAEIVRALVGYERRGSRFVGLVRLENFYGIGQSDQSIYHGEGRYSEDDPGYSFWPADKPGRDKAVALYFLKRLAFELVRPEYDARLDGYPSDCVTHCGVCIDKPLLDFVGRDAFPHREELDPIYTLVCCQEVWNANQR